MFCGINVWAFRGQQMNPNRVIERIQQAAQQDCVFRGKTGRRFVGWINGFVWYSQMLALTKQLTLISFIIYDMWVYTCTSHRETQCTSVKERACVWNSCSIFQSAEKLSKEENKTKNEHIWSLVSLSDNATLKPNCQTFHFIQNHHIGR